jgi:hypothetical protein
MPDPPGTQWLKTARQLPPSFVIGKPQGLLKPGNLDLNQRPTVRNPDGSISTVRTISVTDDKGANEDAIAHWKKTGEHLGYFDTEDSANAYAEALHEAQAQQYGPQNP